MQHVYCMHDYMTPFVTCYHSTTKPATNRPKPPRMPALTVLSWALNHFWPITEEAEEVEEEWTIKNTVEKWSTSLGKSQFRQLIFQRGLGTLDACNLTLYVGLSLFWLNQHCFCLLMLLSQIFQLFLHLLDFNATAALLQSIFQVLDLIFAALQFLAKVPNRRYSWTFKVSVICFMCWSQSWIRIQRTLRACVFLLWCMSQWNSTVCVHWHVCLIISV